QAACNVSCISVIMFSGAAGSTGTYTLSLHDALPILNDPPVITGLTNVTVAANQTLTMNFTISDVDSPLTDLSASATSSNIGLGSVAISGANGNQTLSFTPSGVTGNTLVTVIASDRQATTTNTIQITVTNVVNAV